MILVYRIPYGSTVVLGTVLCVLYGYSDTEWLF